MLGLRGLIVGERGGSAANSFFRIPDGRASDNGVELDLMMVLFVKNDHARSFMHDAERSGSRNKSFDCPTCLSRS